ncbi:hypothetical protein TKK_0014123 [Trichogramma kaykai]
MVAMEWKPTGEVNASREKNAIFDRVSIFMRLFLQPIGIWPLHTANYTSKTRFCLSVFCLTAVALVAGPHIYYVSFVMADTHVRIRHLPPISFYSINTVKYVVFIMISGKFSAFVRLFARDWRSLVNEPRQLSIMLNYTSKAKYLIVASIILLYGNAIPFIILLPPMTKLVDEATNVTYRTLCYPGHYFDMIDPKQSQFTYSILYVVQTYFGFSLVTCTLGFLSVFVTFGLHVSARCNITSLLIQELVDDYSSARLKFIVGQHCQSLKLVADLEDTFKLVFLLEILGTLILLCFTGFVSILDLQAMRLFPLFTNLIIIMSFSYNIFVYCYVGEKVSEQCSSVAKSIYRTNWYELTPLDARNLCYIMVLAQHPVQLTAGTIMILSLENFTKFAKVSFNSLNMIRKILESTP